MVRAWQGEVPAGSRVSTACFLWLMVLHPSKCGQDLNMLQGTHQIDVVFLVCSLGLR